MRNWSSYTVEVLRDYSVSSENKGFILGRVDNYIEYCHINNVKVRRERIRLIVYYELYKLNGIVNKNISKNNHKRMGKFLNIFFKREQHIYNEFLDQIK